MNTPDRENYGGIAAIVLGFAVIVWLANIAIKWVLSL